MLDRNSISAYDKTCPICEVGHNSPDYGGNEKCFHCGNCWFVECIYEGDPVEEHCDNIMLNPEHIELQPDIDNIRKRLIDFYK